MTNNLVRKSILFCVDKLHSALYSVKIKPQRIHLRTQSVFYSSLIENKTWRVDCCMKKSKMTRSTATSSCSTASVNQLIHEKSPYLLQHAHNPVNWFPWSDEAINKAKNENKLIFLSVGYSTCHWCHVMERESFENESIASIMNENFVNIKVDREERPDVDKIYMTFILLTSGSGGWPMSVFLTPDLNPIGGGTYFPSEDKFGRPGFKTILLKMSRQWKENPQAVSETGNKVINTLRKASKFNLAAVETFTRDAVPKDECSKLCLQQLSRQFDDYFGGFSIAPKFPQPSNLMFLFHFYSRNIFDDHGKSALDMALKTLRKMANGGIHDHIGKGFARYSTDEKWHVPHFEKMLYDQGQLAVVYAVAYLITKNKLFADIVHDILIYVSRDLSHKEGGFYSAEDADSLPSLNATEKREGAFYVWTYNEVENLLNQPLENYSHVQLFEVFSHYYNIQKDGNVDPQNDPHGELDNKNVLIILGSEEETAEKFGISLSDLNKELQKARTILFEERNKRPRPHLDSKIITSWNGLMLSGFAKAAQVLQNDNYKIRATEAAIFIKKYLWLEDNKELLHCCYVEENEKNIVQISRPIHGFLDDYVFLIRGLLDLYECTYDSKLIEWSEQLQDIQNSLFWDDAGKAYNLASVHGHTTILTLKDDQDGAEPAGNSVAVQNLLRLAALLDRSDYEDKAKHILSAYTSRLTRLPASLPEMVCSLMFYHDSAVQIFVVENGDVDKAKEMLTAVHEYYIPNRVLAIVDNAQNSILYQKSEAAKNMRGHGKTATAHLCRNQVCSLPVKTVDEFRRLLTEK